MLPQILPGVSSYLVFGAAAFVMGGWWSGHRAVSRGLDPNVVPDMGFYVLVCSLAFARLASVINEILNGHLRLTDWSNIVHFMFNGGLVAYGGLLGGAGAAFGYFRLKRLPFKEYADVFAPPLALGVVLFRIGCFLNGCCFGKPTESIFAISFPVPSSAGYFQRLYGFQGLFPSQLFAAFNGLIILVVLVTLDKRYPPGYLFAVFCTSYGVSRFAVDFSRHYLFAEKYLGITLHQWLSLLIVSISVGWMLWTSRVLKSIFRSRAIEETRMGDHDA